MGYEEIIGLVAIGIGYLVEYIRRGKNDRAKSVVEQIDRWVPVAFMASMALRDQGIIKSDAQLWKATELKVASYMSKAGFKMTPRLRLYIRQRALDEGQYHGYGKEIGVTPLEDN